MKIQNCIGQFRFPITILTMKIKFQNGLKVNSQSECCGGNFTPPPFYVKASRLDNFRPPCSAPAIVLTRLVWRCN